MDEDIFKLTGVHFFPNISKSFKTVKTFKHYQEKISRISCKDFEMRNDNPLWQSSRFSPFLSLQKEEYCVRFWWYPTTSPAFAEIILQSIAC